MSLLTRFIPNRIACALAIGGAVLPASPAGPQKHLLLDSRLIASSRNIAIDVGQAQKFQGNPLFGAEYPWEPEFANMYTSVIWDAEDRLYKCWYNLFVVYKTDWTKATKERQDFTYRQNGVAYAASTDGVHWRKPLFAEFPFEGRPSNVLVRGISGVGVIKDARESDPARRYKMFLRRDEGGPRGPAVAFSADGIHWGTPVAVPTMKVHADTYNNAIWAPTLGKYVAMTRDWGPASGVYPEGLVAPVLNQRDRIRLVSRAESDDFVHWTELREVLKGSNDIQQVYDLPMFHYEGIYLGFPALYNIVTNKVQTELAWSPDTVAWHRISPGKALIGPGSRPGAYDWGCVYQAPPVIGRDEIRLYYGGSDAPHTGFRSTFFCLAVLRPDGFAAATPAEPGTGQLTTVAVERAPGNRILITADIEAGGSVQVVALDPADGEEIGRCGPILGGQHLTAEPFPIDSIQAFRAGPVRLRFILDKARLYSFSL